MSVTVVASGGNIGVTLLDESVSVATGVNPDASTWDRAVEILGRGYNYPQPTGQTTVYRTGDDADIEATIFSPIRAANSLKAQNSLADFTTLNNTNAFGNTDRFTDINGLQVYGDDYVIDHYTGLGWYRVLQSSVIWDTAIDNAIASTQNGYTDWFLPAQYILASISQNIKIESRDYSPFNITTAQALTSTSRAESTTLYMFSTSGTNFAQSGKTNARTYLICRKHY